MTIADEIEQLQALHAQGALTDAEFAQAKAALLTRYAGEVPQQHAHRNTLGVEHELARLDREWLMERETYMVTSRYGARAVPSQGGSLVTALLIGGFGIFWTLSATSMGAPSVFPLFGVLFILVGVGASVHAFMKAGAYQRAEQAYQQRRAHVLAQHPSAARDMVRHNEP